jgi:chaperonin GroES
MNVKLINDRILVLPIEDADKTESGLILHQTSKDELFEGVVLSAGKGLYKDGVFTPLEIKVGDHVFYGKFAGQPVNIKGRDLLIMREADVYGVFEGEDLAEGHQIEDGKLKRTHHRVNTEVDLSTLLNDAKKKEFIALTGAKAFLEE